MSEESWERVQSLLKEKLNKPSYETWIRQLQFRSFKNGELTLIAWNDFSVSWLRKNYSKLIQATAEEIYGEPLTLKIEVSKEGMLILSDPSHLDWSKEGTQKRLEKQRLKEKQIRQKIRRYLYAALIIIGAILVILRT